MNKLADLEAVWHNRIAEEMAAKGFRMGLGRALSDDEVAHGVGVARTTIHKWRTQQTVTIPATMALRLSLYFDVPVDRLFRAVQVQRKS